MLWPPCLSPFNPLPYNPGFYDLKGKTYENIWEKGENAAKKHFLHFSLAVHEVLKVSFCDWPSHIISHPQYLLMKLNQSCSKD